ncbi:MAG TPA: hypothetical protein VEI97_11075, partial [bacterium]|nr:hypothetical protein [bacterium]
SWTTYTVARSKGVGVGVIDFPLLMEAALLGTSVKGQVPSASFSLGLAKGGKVRFYSETPFQDGTLAMAVEAASWEYVP